MTNLHDRSLEQPLAAWEGQVIHDTSGTSRFTKHSDLVRITAKAADLIVHPFQRHLLVLDPHVTCERTVFKACLHQASESVLRQLYHNANGTALIENNEVSRKWVAKPAMF